jgi:hypothetical protein
LIRSLKVIVPGLLVVALTLAAANMFGTAGPKPPSSSHAPCSSGTPKVAKHYSSSSASTDLASLRADAVQLAHDAGISVPAAIRALRLQPSVGRLQAALENQGPRSFGGAFLDYKPRYRITLLAEPGCGSVVAAAIPQLGFGKLKKYISVRETPYTEDVLTAAMTRLQKAAGPYLTTLDADIRTGRVLASAATSPAVATVRSIIAALQPPLRARGVIVTKGAFHDTAGGPTQGSP